MKKQQKKQIYQIHEPGWSQKRHEERRDGSETCTDHRRHEETPGDMRRPQETAGDMPGDMPGDMRRRRGTFYNFLMNGGVWGGGGREVNFSDSDYEYELYPWYSKAEGRRHDRLRELGDASGIIGTTFGMVVSRGIGPFFLQAQDQYGNFLLGAGGVVMVLAIGTIALKEYRKQDVQRRTAIQAYRIRHGAWPTAL